MSLWILRRGDEIFLVLPEEWEASESSSETGRAVVLPDWSRETDVRHRSPVAMSHAGYATRPVPADIAGAVLRILPV
jgi:hypothetical protein